MSGYVAALARSRLGRIGLTYAFGAGCLGILQSVRRQIEGGLEMLDHFNPPDDTEPAPDNVVDEPAPPEPEHHVAGDVDDELRDLVDTHEQDHDGQPTTS